MGCRRRNATGVRSGPSTLALVLALVAGFSCAFSAAPAAAPLLTRSPPAPAAVRGLWVLRGTLTTPARIDRLVREAADSGVNTLFLQVRARGDAFFAGSVEPKGDGIAPGFDPLAHALAAAHRAGLRVHAWINVNLVSSAVTLPVDRRHLVHTHPEWLMAPRELAPALARLRPDHPQYVSQLAAWTRSRRTRLEGLYVSPIPAGAARHLEGIVAELATRYPIDGLHLDYVRYPGPQFDYSAAALDAFRAAVAPSVPLADRRRLDARLATHPLAYVDTFPVRWTEFRRARLADLVARLRRAVKARRPEAAITAAVVPDPVEALRDRQQDWPDWARRGLIDAICPMAYATDLARFRDQIGEVRRAAGTTPIWAGIGAYRLGPDQIGRHIAAARTAGADGVVLFSYDSLIEGPRRALLPAIGPGAFATPGVPVASSK